MKRLALGITRALPALAVVGIAACEAGPKETVQVGYRGVGQEINYDLKRQRALAAANKAPDPLPPASPSSPPANWQNVQVLNDVSANELNRTMIAMTAWVSPKQGCAYCHDPRNYASDSIYAKVVARRMLQMTRHVNSGYQSHVQGTGVTCYSCHRGAPVPPAGLWHYTDQNQVQRAYLDRSDVRVQSLTVGNTPDNRSSIKQAEQTYALMINVSQSLGVNCTFCHNSRSWATWQNAPPARITSMYGFRMVRDLNTNYVSPLQAVLPAARLGVHGDAPKMSCATCHQGAYKPLFGAPMAKDYPALWGAPQWARGGPSDTVNAGFRDLRNADSIPTERAARLHPEVSMPLPAPVRGTRGPNPR